MSNELEQLLREADASAGPPAARIVDLVGSVRALARRRRRTVRTGAAVAALLVGLTVVLALQPRRPAPVVRSEPTPASVEELERTMAELRAEAQVRAAVVQRLVVAERRRERTHRAAAPDPLLAVRREQDNAAYLLIYEADRLARQDGERKRAVDEYRRVLALFPETHWASVARERLVALDASSRRSHGPGLPAVGIAGEGEDIL